VACSLAVITAMVANCTVYAVRWNVLGEFGGLPLSFPDEIAVRPAFANVFKQVEFKA
jgi:hypothetical protein